MQGKTMSEPQAAIRCSVCGRDLHLWDVVIVSHEVPPTWASPGESKATAVVHERCEPDERRADHDWAREPPQTLLHWLTMLAANGGQKLEPELA